MHHPVRRDSQSTKSHGQILTHDLVKVSQYPTSPTFSSTLSRIFALSSVLKAVSTGNPKVIQPADSLWSAEACFSFQYNMLPACPFQAGDDMTYQTKTASIEILLFTVKSKRGLLL